MWPRTHEERARQRNTGFVCFMTREGAEDAMESLAEQDPLGTGRRLLINWVRYLPSRRRNSVFDWNGTGLTLWNSYSVDFDDFNRGRMSRRP